MTATKTGATPFKNMALLVIDDNENTRKLLVEICRMLGTGKAVIGKTPEVGLSLLETARFDCVIVEWATAPLDAIQFTRAVRRHADARVRHTPIVIMKHAATRADVTAARDAGANEFLSPPLTLQAVQSKFESVFLKPRAFVEGQSFSGPDRRRARDGDVRDDGRRADDTKKA